ncbi:MAG TPA: tetratricopeptide repeat protein [Vicinamibacterales bacterium]|nr:tetratricopeptide repeat protein [Vicinamibacterales bacterium]
MTIPRQPARRRSRLNRPNRPAAVASLLLVLGAPLVAQQAGSGLITFPTSGSQVAHREFLRGVEALHSFEYEEANEAFVKAQQIEPGFAMAYWGEAMTYHQTLWRKEDPAAARRVLLKLGPTMAARAAKAPTLREKAFLAAIEVLFGPGDATARRSGYARAMEQLYSATPGDPDVAAFYALALMGLTSRGLVGSADAHEGHLTSLAGSDTQRRVHEILDKVLQSHPNHPGALHYLLHTLDDPQHAALALEAARRYAKVAAGSSHALHMPAHIFLQLGMWREAAQSDRAAYAASEAWVSRKGLSPALRNYHALAWLQYELLQMGQFQEASELIGRFVPVVKATRQLTLLNDLASMRARFVVETRRWDILAGETNFGNVNELFAVGMSAARLGNAPAAELARQRLAERAQSAQEGDLRPAIAIMEREVAALIALAAGRRDEALQILRTAVEAELKLPPPLGLPNPIKPAPELLGELLVEAGRPRDALEAFQQALQRNPNRTLSVLGRARAAAAAGETETAREHYRALLANYEQADADRPEVNEAQVALRAARPSTGAVTVGAGLAGLLSVAFFARKRALRRATRRRRHRALPDRPKAMSR